MFNATEELENVSKYKDIRLFTVMQNSSTSPQYDLLKVEENWKLPSNGQ